MSHTTGILLGLSLILGCAEPSDEFPNLPDERAFCGQATAIEPVCRLPWLPQLTRIHTGAELALVSPSGTQFEIRVHKAGSGSRTTQWQTASDITFDTPGHVQVDIRLTDASQCETAQVSRRYEVVTDFEPVGGAVPRSRISLEDHEITHWAHDVAQYVPGDRVDDTFQDATQALGRAGGQATKVVSLGGGGRIELLFDPPIADGAGSDFAVFENGFNAGFLELAYVEVSSNGVDFVRFPNIYLGQALVGPFSQHESRLITGFAGKYPAGFGDGFDLNILAWSPETQDGRLNLHHVTHVRLLDIIGDGRQRDTFGNPIFDPYPTTDSAGFDLDGIGVMNTAATHPCPTLN
jgi:hypothetical protein